MGRRATRNSKRCTHKSFELCKGFDLDVEFLRNDFEHKPSVLDSRFEIYKDSDFAWGLSSGFGI